MKVKIDRLGINGEGVFRLGDDNSGKVGFVSFALPNEEVEVSITKEKSSYCEADLKEVITKSDSRIEPQCPYFYKCGGCDIQHANTITQIEFKKNKIIETIKKIAKIDNVKINEFYRVNDFGYRNKQVFPFGMDNGRVIIGMYQKSSHKIVDIEKCLLAESGINSIYVDSKQFFENNKKYIDLIKNKILKYLVVRGYNNKYLITLVVKKNIDISDYCKYITEKKSNIGISIIIGDSDNEILSGEYRHIFGMKQLHIEEMGLKYDIDNRGFLQVNNDIKKLIYEHILNEISSEDIVIDAYSGAGLLTSIVAKKAQKAIGIEINKSASKSAENMAKFNSLHNTFFYNNDIKDKIDECLISYPNSVLILDPTRSGCDDVVIDKIISNNLPKKIIYLSCNVATLSRDLQKLKDHYQISFVNGYDMFPNTKHVETLVCLQRRV